MAVQQFSYSTGKNSTDALGSQLTRNHRSFDPRNQAGPLSGRIEPKLLIFGIKSAYSPRQMCIISY